MEMPLDLRDDKVNPATYNHLDPKDYVGPVVRGWGLKKNRDTKVYIRPWENTVVNGEIKKNRNTQ